MIYYRPYGVAGTIRKFLADYTNPKDPAAPTFAAGDAKVAKDGGTPANATNLPAMVNGRLEWDYTVAEVQAAQTELLLVDQDGPAWMQPEIIIETFGDPASEHGGLSPADIAAFELGQRAVVRIVADTGTTATVIKVKTAGPALTVDDQWVDRRVWMPANIAGANLRGQAKPIIACDATAQTITVGDGGFAAAPGLDDEMVVG